nr:glycoside hydrolase family 88 protein [Gorillibacterium timonense]
MASPVFREKPKWTKEEAEAALGFVLKKIDENLEVFSRTFPDAASQGGVYPAVDNFEWTPGFWTGMLWLAYEATGQDRYRETAEKQLESFYDRIEQGVHIHTHDLGFVYSLSCVAAYKLTGNEQARIYALKAADLLLSRTFPKAGIIQAWGDLNDPNQRGRMIIDCLMNLPLLYWASQETGDLRYREAAVRHADQASRYMIREDASTYHTFFMDTESGAPLRGTTHQGFSDDSCWARGQAWGIYGFPLSSRYTGNAELLERAKRLGHYFLNRLPADFVPYWDLIFTSGAEERDSSAAAIAACGFLEQAEQLPVLDEFRSLYENAALHMLKSLSESYTTADLPNSNGLLKHGVYSKPGGAGVDECTIWGDYFYLEALIRVTRNGKAFW